MKSRAQALSEFMQFVDELAVDDRVGLVFHKDGDGMCSAVVTAMGLEKMRSVSPAAWFPTSYGVFQSHDAFIRNVRQRRCNKLVCMDLNIDQSVELVRELENTCERLLIVDHHKILHDVESAKTRMIKAQFLVPEREPSQYPNAKVMFDLWSECTDMTDADWKACIGVASDMGMQCWRAFVDETMRRNRIALSDIETLRDIVSSVESVAEERFLDLTLDLWKARAPADIITGEWLAYRDEFERELKHWTDAFETHARTYPELELAIFEINPAFSIRSPLSNRLSQKYPSTTMVIMDTGRADRAIFSFRRQDFKVAMNDLVEKSVHGIPGGTGGGHVPAAAGSVPKAFADQFCDNLVRELQKQKSTHP